MGFSDTESSAISYPLDFYVIIWTPDCQFTIIYVSLKVCIENKLKEHVNLQ